MEALSTIQSCGSFLKAELSRRQARNAAYSLRAFARDLDVSPSRLSEIIGTDSKLSAQTAAKITEKLNLSPSVSQYFVDLAVATTAKSPLRRQMALARIDAFRDQQQVHELTPEEFGAINSWYHLAIIELTKLADFQESIEWIADKLGLDEGEVLKALSALEATGLIRFDEDDHLQVQQVRSRVQSQQPSEAIRKFHRQMIDRAREAIDDLPLEDRDLGALVVAASSRSSPKIRTLLAQLRRELATEIGQMEEPPDGVYGLAMQWVKLTR